MDAPKEKNETKNVYIFLAMALALSGLLMAFILLENLLALSQTDSIVYCNNNSRHLLAISDTHKLRASKVTIVFKVINATMHSQIEGDLRLNCKAPARISTPNRDTNLLCLSFSKLWL